MTTCMLSYLVGCLGSAVIGGLIGWYWAQQANVIINSPIYQSLNDRYVWVDTNLQFLEKKVKEIEKERDSYKLKFDTLQAQPAIAVIKEESVVEVEEIVEVPVEVVKEVEPVEEIVKVEEFNEAEIDVAKDLALAAIESIPVEVEPVTVKIEVEEIDETEENEVHNLIDQVEIESGQEMEEVGETDLLLQEDIRQAVGHQTQIAVKNKPSDLINFDGFQYEFIATHGQTSYYYRTDANKLYYFLFANQQDQPLFSSKGFDNKADCLRGIDYFINNLEKKSAFVQQYQKGGNHQYGLLDALNGGFIGYSQVVGHEQNLEEWFDLFA